MNAVPNEALKYRSVTDIVRPIRKFVRRREKGIGHSVRRKENRSSLFVHATLLYLCALPFRQNCKK